MERIALCFVPNTDIRNLIFGNEVLEQLTTFKKANNPTTAKAEPLYQRFVRYLEDAHRNQGDRNFYTRFYVPEKCV